MRKRLLIGMELLATFGGLVVGSLTLRPEREVRHFASPPSLDPTTTLGHSTQKALSGTLLDGRSWSLRDDPAHGLCLTIGTAAFGCDDNGNRGIDPAAPRKAVEANRYPESQSGVPTYGFLPANAENVVLVDQGGSVIPGDLVVEPSSRFWAAPVLPGERTRRTSHTWG
jgi:hypothetical protein